MQALAKEESGLFVLTNEGKVKKLPGTEFVSKNSKKFVYAKLNENEVCVCISKISKDMDIILVSSAGRFLRFYAEEIPDAKKTQKCMTGISLKEKDTMTDWFLVEKEKETKTIKLKDGREVELEKLQTGKRGGPGTKKMLQRRESKS